MYFPRLHFEKSNEKHDYRKWPIQYTGLNKVPSPNKTNSYNSPSLNKTPVKRKSRIFAINFARGFGRNFVI